MVSTSMLYPEQHHPTLYFDDGNVVLSAIAKDGRRRYFRVHQSVLCRHSPIFEEMFQIPPLREDTPEHEIAESYDGVLHIQMPDTAEEVDSLIGVLYDPLYVYLFFHLEQLPTPNLHKGDQLISAIAQIRPSSYTAP